MTTPGGPGTATSTLSSSNPAASVVSIDGANASDPEPFSETEQVLYNAIMATNSISLAACIFTISTYIFLRRKYPRLMSRTSLRLGIAMTCSDAILHAADLTGYFNVPGGFVCGFVGGWMFTTPSFLSTFYACAIALNTQLVFVHNSVPKSNKHILYFIVPPILSLLITVPTLATGVYGFDEAYNYCWYSTHNVSTETVFLRIILTWSLWLFIAACYLIVAVTLITYSLCSKRGPLSGRGMSEYLRRHPSEVHSNPDDVGNTVSTMLERREMARRALTVRVLGYIFVPVICVFPGVIADIITRARPDISVPFGVELFADITAGLMGTLNTILLGFDPSVVAVIFWPYWKKRKDRKRMQRRNKSAPPGAQTHKPALPRGSGDPEVGGTATSAYETQDMGNATFQYDHGLEFFGHLAVDETVDLGTTVTSTIGYNAEELAEIFHGL